MTLPAGFGSQLFKPLRRTEMDFVQEYYDRHEDDQSLWVDILYEGEVKKLPLLHLAFLVCDLSNDKVPIIHWSAGPHANKKKNVERPEFYDDVRQDRRDHPQMQRICNNSKRAIGSSWRSDLIATRKQIEKDLLTNYTLESPRFKMTDKFETADKQRTLESLNLSNKYDYARFKAWEDVALEGGPEYESYDQWKEAVNKTIAEHFSESDYTQGYEEFLIQEYDPYGGGI